MEASDHKFPHVDLNSCIPIFLARRKASDFERPHFIQQFAFDKKEVAVVL